MAVLSKIKSDSDTVGYFKELLSYNKPNKKPNFKLLKDTDLLSQLSFHELNLIKSNQAFRGYTMSYNVEIVE